MILTVVVILAAVVALIVALAATKPDSFRVERSTSINTTPDKIFPLINDFHRWPAWSPWEKLDPDMRKSFGGPPTGVGSSYEWEGNSKAGKGRMEITASTPTKINLNLDFIKPFKANNFTEFSMVPAGDSTDLTWSLYGPSPFITKLMMVFTTMDKMVGKDFDEGITNLKREAEKSTPA